MATTWYVKIEAMNDINELGLDERGRMRFSCNFLAEKRPSTTFAEELVAILIAAGLSSPSIYVGTKVAIPDDAGPYLSIIETGGAAPICTQNSLVPAYQRPTAQLVGRAGTYAAARGILAQAFNALTVVRNQTVTF